ncbi:MAG: hypothetical protein ACTSWI_01490, partial [Alphaproteobacteria bacterium]
IDSYLVVPSSGTSGTVVYSIFSSAEWSRVSALAMRTLPWTPRRRRIAFCGLMGGHQGSATGASTTHGSIARLRFVAQSFDVESPILQTIDELNRYQPDILTGMPTTITELANAQEAGLLSISPELLSLGADAVTPVDRALLDRAFGATISNQYGSSEHLTLGYGLSEDGGIYLFDDEMIFEIEEGRVLVTSLFKYTQPLIRYALDDRLVPMNDPTPRLPFTKVRDIGRRPTSDATFTNRHGKDGLLRANELAELAVPNVERLQLRVFDKLSCLLRVKLRIGLTDAERTGALERVERSLTDIFTDAEMENVSRRIAEVKSFGGRKARLIILPGMPDTMSPSWQRANSSVPVV